MLQPDLTANGKEWDHSLQLARSGELPEADYLPLLELVSASPTVRSFPFFFSHGELIFSRCPSYPFSTAGLPTVTAEDGVFVVDGDRRGSASEVADWLEQVLNPQQSSIFDGNVDQKVFHELLELLPTRPAVCDPGKGGPPYLAQANRLCLVAWGGDDRLDLEWHEDGREVGRSCYRLESAVEFVQNWLGL